MEENTAEGLKKKKKSQTPPKSDDSHAGITNFGMVYSEDYRSTVKVAEDTRPVQPRYVLIATIYNL